GQAVSPDTSRVQSGHVGVAEESQSRPVAEDDARAAPAGALRLEPRNERLALRFLRRSLGAQRQAAFRIQIAQPRETVRNEAQPRFTFQGIVPTIRLIAVQA